MWILYAFLSALSAAFVAIFAKARVKQNRSNSCNNIAINSDDVISYFFAFVGGKYSSFKQSSISLTEWFLILCAGIAGALSCLFYFVAMRNGNVSAVVAIDRLSIVFVICFAAVFFKESLSWRTGIGALLMITGALLISLRVEVIRKIWELLLKFIPN
jgi:transporter family protein